MLSYVLLLLGSAAVAFWGIMHLVKTRPVVAGFEPLTDDNRHVLRMALGFSVGRVLRGAWGIARARHWVLTAGGSRRRPHLTVT
jgi:hypothetical protein